MQKQKKINLNSNRIDHVNPIDLHALTPRDDDRTVLLTFFCFLLLQLRLNHNRRLCVSISGGGIDEGDLAIQEFCVPEVISFRFIMIPPA